MSILKEQTVEELIREQRSLIFLTRRSSRFLNTALARWLIVATGMLTCSMGLAVGPNELVNGSFESGDTAPEAWITGSWNSNVQFSWDNAVAFDGARSIRVQNTGDNDAWWEQAVQLEPNRIYQLSGWVRTEGISEAGAGANLALNGTWAHTDGLHGTSGWTYRVLTFNSGDSGFVTIAARLGHWGGDSTGTAWFDALQLNRIDAADPHPSWKIQVIIYDAIDVTLVDDLGVSHHVRSTISLDDMVTASETLYDFVNTDIPALNSGNMVPTLLPITIPAAPLTTLSPSFPAGRYWPAPEDTVADLDPTADAVIVLWNPHGIDVDTGEEYLINGYAGLTAWMGTRQTYLTAIIDSATVYPDRNVLKHEFGHSLLFYYEAAGVTPTPTVNNHPEVEYVHCDTGTQYVWQDETLANPIPNSIYNNDSGFTHDYFSGQTATIDDPSHCLGITPLAWATGGPVSKPIILPPPDVTPPDVPTHISPADGTVITTANQTLADWTDVTDPSGPVMYYMESSNSSATGGPGGAFTAPIYVSGPLSSSEIPTPGSPEGIGYWHVRAVDSLGNSSAWSDPWQIIVDNTPPTVTAPSDITVYTGPGATSCSRTVTDAELGTATASDNLSGASTPTRSPSGNTFPVGPTVITYSSTDGAGNTGTDTQTITVVDNTAPVITINGANPYMHPYGTAYTDPGATASDNCSGSVAVKTSGTVNSLAPVATTFTITYTATDGNGNTSTATRTVKIVSNPPSNANACKNGGWQFLTRTNGTIFKNQGDCVSYLQNGK